MKIVGMIPARMGSTRVKNKNLRLINNKPLIQYIIDSASKSKLLNDLYVNSESTIFKEISDKSGINFYTNYEIGNTISFEEFNFEDFTSTPCLS